MARDRTAESVSRDRILRRERRQGNIRFPCSADHEQHWQPYPVDPYSAICDDHTYIHTPSGCEESQPLNLSENSINNNPGRFAVSSF